MAWQTCPETCRESGTPSRQGYNSTESSALFQRCAESVYSVHSTTYVAHVVTVLARIVLVNNSFFIFWQNELHLVGRVNMTRRSIKNNYLFLIYD